MEAVDEPLHSVVDLLFGHRLARIVRFVYLITLLLNVLHLIKELRLSLVLSLLHRFLHVLRPFLLTVLVELGFQEYDVVDCFLSEFLQLLFSEVALLLIRVLYLAVITICHLFLNMLIDYF